MPPSPTPRSSPSRCFPSRGVGRSYGERIGCADVSPTSGPARCSASSVNRAPASRPLLRCLAGIDRAGCGRACCSARGRELLDIYSVSEQPERRRLMRTAWGIVRQNPRDGLRMGVSAGGNVGERLMDVGDRHYGNIRGSRARLAAAASRSPPTASTTGRASSRAACSSACRSPACWSPIRASSSWTSRPAASTSRCRPACSTCVRVPGRANSAWPSIIVDARSRRRAAAHRTGMMVMQARPRGRAGPDRPGAGRSAARLHPASRLLGARGRARDPPLTSCGPAAWSAGPCRCLARASPCICARACPSSATSTMSRSRPGPASASLGGPSRAGKSSLMRILYGNLSPRHAAPS